MNNDHMDIKLRITKNKRGFDITGTIVLQDNSSENKPETPTEPEYDYKVLSVKPSGKSSQLLELADKNGEVTAAYIKAGGLPITEGSYLTEVDLQQKTGAYGAYNMINACKIAA